MKSLSGSRKRPEPQARSKARLAAKPIDDKWSPVFLWDEPPTLRRQPATVSDTRSPTRAPVEVTVIEDEKRRYERRPLFRPLTLYRLGVELSTGRTLNLSPAGACVIMRKPMRLRVGDAVNAKVSIPRRSLTGLRFEQVVTPSRVCRIEDLGNELAVALEFLEEVDVV